MEIKVYGPGCERCKKTKELVCLVVEELAVKANISKISDIKEIMAAGVISTPAVSVDGVLKSSGKIPTKDEIISWISG